MSQRFRSHSLCAVASNHRGSPAVCRHSIHLRRWSAFEIRFHFYFRLLRLPAGNSNSPRTEARPGSSGCHPYCSRPSSQVSCLNGLIGRPLAFQSFQTGVSVPSSRLSSSASLSCRLTLSLSVQQPLRSGTIQRSLTLFAGTVLTPTFEPVSHYSSDSSVYLYVDSSASWHSVFSVLQMDSTAHLVAWLNQAVVTTCQHSHM